MLLSQCKTVGEVGRRIGVSEQSYYRWRKEYGGLKIEEARRLKELEQENARLKRAFADLTMDRLILKEAAEGKFLSPKRRRRCVQHVRGKQSRDRAARLPGSRSVADDISLSADPP